jgi:endonuclease-3
MAESRAQNVLRILRKEFTTPRWITSAKDPFVTLIATVISQNTNDKNTSKAFEMLSNRFKIKPEALAKAQTSQIEQCLKVAGLYRNKAKAIKQISQVILTQYGGTLNPILSLSLEEARKALMQLPSVGPKTADVVLLFAAHKPTIPVDTHVDRVSKRLGLAPTEGDYEAVRSSLQSVYDPEDYTDAHVLLILHGRKYCKARNPLCKQCPVNDLCPSRASVG